jgi:hypothetical protein
MDIFNFKDWVNSLGEKKAKDHEVKDLVLYLDHIPPPVYCTSSESGSMRLLIPVVTNMIVRCRSNQATTATTQAKDGVAATVAQTAEILTTRLLGNWHTNTFTSFGEVFVLWRFFQNIQVDKTVGGGLDLLPPFPCFWVCFCSFEIFCATVERRLLRFLSTLYQKGAPRPRRPTEKRTPQM